MAVLAWIMVAKFTLYSCDPTMKEHSSFLSLILSSSKVDTSYDEMSQLVSKKAVGARLRAD